MGNNRSEYLEMLTGCYLPNFFSFAVRRTSNTQEAEELAQETASRTFFHFSSLSFAKNMIEFIRKRDDYTMRLFIAINFDENVKQKLIATQNKLREYAVAGNFTKEENLHLTLVFLGETESSRLGIIKSVIDKVESQRFETILNGTGKFSRHGSDLVWVGIEKNACLDKIQSQLYKGLSSAGFTLENRPFSPHLTIAREVKLKSGFDFALFSVETPMMKTSVNKISLMLSERIRGNLIYTEIYAKELP